MNIYSKALAGCAADPGDLDWRESLHFLFRSAAWKEATIANFLHAWVEMEVLDKGSLSRILERRRESHVKKRTRFQG